MESRTYSTEIALNKATQEIENNTHRIKELCDIM